MTTRLVTFNVQHARLPDGAVDPERLAQAVAGLGGDIVALQEVDRGQTRSDGVDLARVVAAGIGATDHRYVPALAGPVAPDSDEASAAFAPVATARGAARIAATARVLRSPEGRAALGAYAAAWRSRRRARGDEPQTVAAYGIALISVHPVREWWRLRLPMGTPWPWGWQLGKDEPRAAVAAVVETPDGPLTVVATHLSSWRRWNRRQLRWLVRRLERAPRPLVLLGDLNIAGDGPAATTGWREVVHSPTFPRHRPRLRIDHVLLDGDVQAAGPAAVLDVGISDHRAVVVDVLMPRGRTRP